MIKTVCYIYLLFEQITLGDSDKEYIKPELDYKVYLNGVIP